MDQQRISESIARQLADVWAIHRTPAFVEYLRHTYGCEPQKPVRFAGIFSLQMIGGYFCRDLPAGPGPVVEQLWLTDDTGFHTSSVGELLSAERLESDNPLVVYDPPRVSDEPIGSQPYLHVYPRLLLHVRGDELILIEAFGFGAWCKKIGKLVVSDRVHIQATRITTRMWQGQLVGTESDTEQNTAADSPHDPGPCEL